jgi:hypothetical protein
MKSERRKQKERKYVSKKERKKERSRTKAEEII